MVPGREMGSQTGNPHNRGCNPAAVDSGGCSERWRQPLRTAGSRWTWERGGGARPLKTPLQLTDLGPLLCHSNVSHSSLSYRRGWEPPQDTPWHFRPSTAERNPEVRSFLWSLIPDPVISETLKGKQCTSRNRERGCLWMI